MVVFPRLVSHRCSTTARSSGLRRYQNKCHPDNHGHRRFWFSSTSTHGSVFSTTNDEYERRRKRRLLPTMAYTQYYKSVTSLKESHPYSRRSLSTAASSSSDDKTESSSHSTPKRDVVTRRLYRSLLRASQPYSRPPYDKVLSALLHRTGIEHAHPHYDSDDDNDDDTELRQASTDTSSSKSSKPLTAEQARDLSKGYAELQKRHHRHRRATTMDDFDYDDDDEDDFDDDDEDDFMHGHSSPTSPHQVLFRILLKELVLAHNSLSSSSKSAENNHAISALMRFPSQLPSNRPTVTEIIQREFRSSNHEGISHSKRYSKTTRMQTAFLALRALNTKLVYAEKRGLDVNAHVQMAKTKHISNKNEKHLKLHDTVEEQPGVSPRFGTETNNTSSAIQPGMYLVAHPLIDGFFAKTVICILDHTEGQSDAEKEENDATVRGGTYGLVLNKSIRLGNSSGSGNTVHGGALGAMLLHDTDDNDEGEEKSIQVFPRRYERTAQMQEVLKTMPPPLREAFGSLPIKNGGPVNAALQMVYECHTLEEEEKAQGPAEGGGEEEDLGLGGHLIPDSSSSSMGTSVYYQGDPLRAAQAVMDGKLERDQFAFYVGASCWSVGQLEAELKRGWWMPCAGPPHLAMGCGGLQTNKDDNHDGEKRYCVEEDAAFWQSMMAAMGEEEAILAQLCTATVKNPSTKKENEGEEGELEGDACDEF